MSIDQIKFGNQSFALVPDGVILGESGGTIVFKKGEMTFDEIEDVLRNNAKITRIGVSGVPEWSRADLVYAGKLTKQSGYIVTTEQVMIGGNEHMMIDTKTDVMIAEFRAPDIREQIAATNAKLLYLSMMTGIDMEGV